MLNEQYFEHLVHQGKTTLIKGLLGHMWNTSCCATTETHPETKTILRSSGSPPKLVNNCWSGRFGVYEIQQKALNKTSLKRPSFVARDDVHISYHYVQYIYIHRLSLWRGRQVRKGDFRNFRGWIGRATLAFAHQNWRNFLWFALRIFVDVNCKFNVQSYLSISPHMFVLLDCNKRA